MGLLVLLNLDEALANGWVEASSLESRGVEQIKTGSVECDLKVLEVECELHNLGICEAG